MCSAIFKYRKKYNHENLADFSIDGIEIGVKKKKDNSYKNFKSTIYIRKLTT